MSKHGTIIQNIVSLFAAYIGQNRLVPITDYLGRYLQQ
jgi:hypothetical protein